MPLLKFVIILGLHYNEGAVDLHSHKGCKVGWNKGMKLGILERGVNIGVWKLIDKDRTQ